MVGNLLLVLSKDGLCYRSPLELCPFAKPNGALLTRTLSFCKAQLCSSSPRWDSGCYSSMVPYGLQRGSGVSMVMPRKGLLHLVATSSTLLA